MWPIGQTTACTCEVPRLANDRTRPRCQACSRVRLTLPHESPQQALAVTEWRNDHGTECTCFACVLRR